MTTWRDPTRGAQDPRVRRALDSLSRRLNDVFPLEPSTYTPTWTQNVAITKTVNFAQYIQIGPLVFGSVKMTASSAGTAGNAILVGLPFAATDYPLYGHVGSVVITDSGTTNYGGSLILSSAGGSTCCLQQDNDPTVIGDTYTIANTDWVEYSFMYFVPLT